MLSMFLAAALLGAGADETVDSPKLDLTKIERVIKKEPEYKSKSQKYALVLFGPMGDIRVWLVFDGDRCFVDRNGNGDLTEPGEVIGPKDRSVSPCDFEEAKIASPKGKGEGRIRVCFWDWIEKSEEENAESPIQLSISMWWENKRYGAWGDEKGDPEWGRTAADAPIFVVGGPLQMGFEEHIELAFKRLDEDKFEIFTGVGTKGLGNSAFTHLSYGSGAIPKTVFPTAEFEFPNKTPGGPPIRVKAVLKRRC